MNMVNAESVEEKSTFERFKFKSKEEVESKINELGLELKSSNNIDVLLKPVTLKNNITIPNSICSLPMEGYDSEPDGGPSEISFAKYKRVAEGGSGLIWVEACAVVPEGRTNSREFWINKNSKDKFKKLVDIIKESALKKNNEEPVVIIQLTHSGRYSKPEGHPAPVIAHHSPYLDPLQNISEDYPLISDEELDELKDKFVDAAILAENAGFDGIDIKSCHGYLLEEILASHTRKYSKYGGSFENRTRFLLETMESAASALSKSFLTTRLGITDFVPYPYGFGMSNDGSLNYDLDEPLKLIEKLKKYIPLLGISIGNPYYKPHYGRPFDTPVKGSYIPPEHPLESMARIVEITKKVQMANPELPIVGFGYTWLRQYMPYFVSYIKEQNWASIIGLGRAILAYPDIVNDLKERKELDPKKVCITCSLCTAMMRNGTVSGCSVRFPDIYRQYL